MVETRCEYRSREWRNIPVSAEVNKPEVGNK